MTPKKVSLTTQLHRALSTLESVTERFERLRETHNRTLSDLAQSRIANHEKQTLLAKESRQTEHYQALYASACERADHLSRSLDYVKATSVPLTNATQVKEAATCLFVFKINYSGSGSDFLLVEAADYEDALDLLQPINCESIEHAQDAVLREFGGIAGLTDN